MEFKSYNLINGLFEAMTMLHDEEGADPGISERGRGGGGGCTLL